MSGAPIFFLKKVDADCGRRRVGGVRDRRRMLAGCVDADGGARPEPISSPFGSPTLSAVRPAGMIPPKRGERNGNSGKCATAHPPERGQKECEGRPELPF